MKTDSEDSLRVTITFRRESNPEWYDYLVRIGSGRARADLVRQHLPLPRSTREKGHNTTETPHVTVKKNEAEFSNGSATLDKPVVNQRDIPTLTEVAEPLGAANSRTTGRSGMASLVLRDGEK